MDGKSARAESVQLFNQWTVEASRILETLGSALRESSLHDGYHSCLRSRVPGNMPHKTHACCRATELPLAETQEPDIHIFPTFVPQHVNEVMNSKDGLSFFYTT